MNSPLLHEPGAVAASPPDADVADHYGDPLGEQRVIARAAAVTDRSHRGVIEVAGPDRLRWLHSLTTAHLENLGAGDSAQALVLSPHGHVEHHLMLTDDGSRTWIGVEPGTAATLIAFLESMRFMLDVQVTDRSAELATISVLGPAAAAALAVAGPVVTITGPLGTDLLIPRGELAAALRRMRDAGAGLAGLSAYEAARIAARIPRLGLDTDHRTLPHEAGWIDSAVHLSKGCYRGQETVARVHNLGHPPRRLVLLHLDGSENRLPGHGTPVQLDGAPAGFTGSAAHHHELGPIGLALVKRTIPVTATLSADGLPAAPEGIGAPEAGATGRAALRRRGALAPP